ncbi:MAG: ABC-F family ATP-binding cassette domain-containing protein [Deltaproteobacteria bacterium]
MIFLHGVGKFFNGRPLFQDASISVHRGDRVGIVGPNGAGKSTLLGLMEGAITPDEGKVTIEKKVRMGVLHQEVISGVSRPVLQEVMDVSDQLSHIRERLIHLEQKMGGLAENSRELKAALERHGRLQHEFESRGGYSLEARALKVLQGLGFQPEDATRSWDEFSGGWRMRVALAKILLAEPDLLLLDEPTNHLDLESLLWLEDYLSGFGGAMVIVSHDRAFLNRLVNKIIEVEQGRVATYTGNYETYEKNRRMQEKVLQAAYKNQQEKIKRIQKFIDQNRVKARTASRVQSRVKMLNKIDRIEPPSTHKTVSFNFPQPARSGRRVVEITDLVKRFGDITVYDGFSLVVHRQDRIALVGPNGAGKSTLMKIIGGVLPYEAGTVKYGHKVKAGYFAQHQLESLNPDWTALEEAASASPGTTEQEVRNLLGAFLFSGDDVHKRVKVLSGGEKSRLALAKLLLAPPNLLLMDEPTNNLDIPSCEILEQALKKFEGTLILITHDRRMMNEICTGILEIDKGHAEFYLGTYDEYLHAKRQPRSNQPDATLTGPTAVSEKEQPSRGKESRKDRRRREAENRKALFKQRAPLAKEIRRIEEQLQLKDERIKEIQALMADPETYANRELILPLLEEEPALAKEIRELEARWEEFQNRLSEIDN